jgi:molybdenum cofactor cytidylyltransferase
VPTALLLLAAGASRRLGQPKQLLTLAGQSLLRRAAEAALATGAGPVVVVLGANADQQRPELAGLSVVVAPNPDWASGMASSLRVGLAAAELAQPGLSAALVMLCDQPFVSPLVLGQLLETFAATSSPIVASRYANGVVGVPIVFGAGCFPALRALTGDQGARKLVAQWPSPVPTVDFPLGQYDVDTPEDWDTICALAGS